MPIYRVTWTTYVTASCPEQAAMLARDAQTSDDPANAVYQVSGNATARTVNLAQTSCWMDEASDTLELLIPTGTAIEIGSMGQCAERSQRLTALVRFLADQLNALPDDEKPKVFEARGYEGWVGTPAGRNRVLVNLACTDIARSPDTYNAAQRP